MNEEPKISIKVGTYLDQVRITSGHKSSTKGIRKFAQKINKQCSIKGLEKVRSDSTGQMEYSPINSEELGTHQGIDLDFQSQTI